MDGTATDNTAFVDAKVREAADIFLAAFVEAPVGQVLLTADGRVLAVNRVYAELKGREPGDMIGQGIETVVPPAGLRAAIADMAHLVRRPSETREHEEVIESADGSRVRCQIVMSVLAVGDRPKLIFRQVMPLEPQEPAAVKEADTQADGEAGRVLVVEDNPINRELVTLLMERDGHKVTGVENGVDAVAAARDSAFDVILMDIQLPQMDGVTATRHIRGMKGTAAAVPIIAVTANVLPADRDRYREAGINDIVGKPIDAERLSRLVREAIQRRRARGHVAA